MANDESGVPTTTFGVVGVGWAGIRHLEAIEAAGDGLKAAAICDIDRGQAESVGARFGVSTITTRLEDLLEDPTIDVIDICTPHPFHASMAVDAARAGKHVLVEKPMAASVSEALGMIKVAEEMGVALGVAEHQVYDETTRTVSSILAQAELGPPAFAVGSWGFREADFSYPGRRSWLTDPSRGGTGTWMLQGIHRVAQLRFLFGEVALVYAVEHKNSSFARIDIEGTISALLTFASGLPVQVTQSSEVRAPDEFQGLTIYCEEGIIRATDFTVQVTGTGIGGEATTTALERDSLRPYVRELKSFARHLTTRTEFPTLGRSEISSLAVVEAGYRSVSIGAPVEPSTL